MKTKFIFFTLLLFFHCLGFSQYIGVRARYTETRLVDDLPNPSKRENRLILSFFEVSGLGVYSPVSLSNYDIWIQEQGVQYGSLNGGVLDSTGNNYAGYPWTAPQVVSYYNSYGINYMDCSSTGLTHYVVNGHELDCGFITVSYWDVDNGTGNAYEAFPAPNVCLPYYQPPHPLAWLPGNVNFYWPIPPSPPYNMYNFSCPSSSLQLVIRGVLPQGSGQISLPVRFVNIRAEIAGLDTVMISWSNQTESEILNYEIESSVDGRSFNRFGTVLPSLNNGSNADYTYGTILLSSKTFYRIKATEISGSFFYSTIVSVSKSVQERISNFSVFPNPVTGDQMSFRLTNAEPGRYIFFILTPEGLHIKQRMIEHAGGDISRQIEMAGLKPGMYQLILRSSTRKYSQKIVYAN